MKTIAVLLILLVISLFSASSCSSTISQEEFDRVNNELNTIQSQLASLKDKSAEYEATKAKYDNLIERYDTLESEHKELQTKYDTEYSVEIETIQDKYDTLKSEYTVLQSEYDELSKQYAALTEGTTEINEEDVEQAIFELINQDRKDNGLDELIWGVHLYSSAKTNSRNMATTQRLEEPPEQIGYQEVIWATGYTKTQRMAEAIFTIWENTYRYELEFLNNSTTYGAVAVYKSGEIFYITYYSGIFQ